MSRHAWLTPDDAPGTALCRTVFIPAGLQYEAAFRGAYLLLCDPENWEETGTQTPETCADAFQAAFFETLENWEECPVSGLIVGEIRIFATPAPTGWLQCDGSLRNIVDYPDLWDALNIHFGGDGIDTFGLPDLRTRFPVGIGGSETASYDLADSGGEDYHTLTIAEIPAHHHTVPVKSGTGAQNQIQTITTSAAPVTKDTGDTGGGGLHENRPPFLALYFYIYAGV